MSQQYPLFTQTLLDSYGDETLDNAHLYQRVASRLKVDTQHCTRPIGKQGQPHNTFARKIRWAQQTFKLNGLIERVARGQWCLTREGKQQLTQTHADKFMIAASTDLGVAIWGEAEHVCQHVIEGDIHLCVTSPPYLDIQRSYGTFRDERHYIDFLLRVLTPICARMVPGANLVLNLSNDSILRQAFGERSCYLERLTLRLVDELGLHLMDRLVWAANDKPPRGYQVTHRRTHLTSRHEPLLWLCNDPSRCLADNRRVLQGYSSSMQRMLKQGGESRHHNAPRDYPTVARTGSFANDNGGSIPGNVLQVPTHCPHNRALLAQADRLGLPRHGALFPQALAAFLLEWLCPHDGRVIDPFGGYLNVASAAEQLQRRWISTEWHWEYLRTAIEQYRHIDGGYVNPLFAQLDATECRQRFAG